MLEFENETETLPEDIGAAAKATERENFMTDLEARYQGRVVEDVLAEVEKN